MLWIVSACVALLTLSNVGQSSAALMMKVGLEHDMSQPTFGLQGPSSSKISYDDKKGLNMQGTINDLLGPPIKIANGVSNIIAGGNMAGIGSTMRANGAMLNVDAHMLETAGGANMLKGGLLLGGTAAKTAAAKSLAGMPGKKIASVIEMPVKVIALKDLATGKVLNGMAKAESVKAQKVTSQADSMVQQGESLRAQGYNQVMQGATEGMHNLDSMMQQASSNVGTAFKLLPIVLDLPMPLVPTSQQIAQQNEEIYGTTKHQTQQKQQQQQQQQQHESGRQSQAPVTGGSLFGGLGSIIPGFDSLTAAPYGSGLGPGLGSSGFGAFGVVEGGKGPAPSGLFGSSPSASQWPSFLPTITVTSHESGDNRLAALLNSTNPLSNLIMNANLNPFLMPLPQGVAQHHTQQIQQQPIQQQVQQATKTQIVEQPKQQQQQQQTQQTN